MSRVIAYMSVYTSLRALIPCHSNLLLLLNYVVVRALREIDVYLINTLVNKSRYYYCYYYYKHHLGEQCALFKVLTLVQVQV